MRKVCFSLLFATCVVVAIPADTGEERERRNLIVRNELKSTWGGLDPVLRKQRLQKLRAHRKTKLNLDEKARIAAAHEFAKNIKQETGLDAMANVFEVNEKSGISDYLLEGDIFLTENQLELLEQEESPSFNKRAKRQASVMLPKWTNNTLYFYFDSTISPEKKSNILNGFQYIQDRTCLNFVENSTATNRMKIFNGTGCYATLGMIGGEQQMSMAYGCDTIGAVVHETFHSLGVYHMQSRSDRDNYVTIDLSDVPEANQHNFKKLDPSVDLSYTPYEYASTMHYMANQFVQTAGELSIIPNDMRYLYSMGSEEASHYDMLLINAHYGCDALCPPTSSANCKNGGVPNPRNCSICNCPSGYGGDLCDRRPDGCGDDLSAETYWKQYSFNLGEANTITRKAFTHCNYWITAPENSQIEMRITYMSNSQCRYGCPFNGIVFKTDVDKKLANPRICCEEFLNVTYKSQLNPTPVIGHNRYHVTAFTFEYRYVPLPTTTPAPAPFTTSSASTSTTTKNEGCNCCCCNHQN